MTPRHVEGFATAGEVLAELCRCGSPVCPLPHDPWRAVAWPEDQGLCDCLDQHCRRPHSPEAVGRFVYVHQGFATAGEVLAELCRCGSPVCPLPHDPWRAVAWPEDQGLCDCLDQHCRRPHSPEAVGRFVYVHRGVLLPSYGAAVLGGTDPGAYQPPQTGKAAWPRSAS